jgi:hypothetical protein
MRQSHANLATRLHIKQRVIQSNESNWLRHGVDGATEARARERRSLSPAVTPVRSVTGWQDGLYRQPGPALPASPPISAVASQVGSPSPERREGAGLRGDSYYYYGPVQGREREDRRSPEREGTPVAAKMRQPSERRDMTGRARHLEEETRLEIEESVDGDKAGALSGNTPSGSWSWRKRERRMPRALKEGEASASQQRLTLDPRERAGGGDNTEGGGARATVSIPLVPTAGSSTPTSAPRGPPVVDRDAGKPSRHTSALPRASLSISLSPQVHASADVNLFTTFLRCRVDTACGTLPRFLTPCLRCQAAAAASRQAPAPSSQARSRSHLLPNRDSFSSTNWQ